MQAVPSISAPQAQLGVTGAREQPGAPIGVDVIGGRRLLTNIRAWLFQRVG